MLDKLHFRMDTLPPSVNKLYMTKFGKRILSGEGRKFKARFIALMGGEDRTNVMFFQADKKKTYALILVFKMLRKNVINDKFDHDKRVKYLYKQVDSSNLIKVVEDSISELLRIPDHNNFIHFVKKDVVTRKEDVGLEAWFLPADHPDILPLIKEML